MKNEIEAYLCPIRIILRLICIVEDNWDIESIVHTFYGKVVDKQKGFSPKILLESKHDMNKSRNLLSLLEKLKLNMFIC